MTGPRVGLRLFAIHVAILGMLLPGMLRLFGLRRVVIVLGRRSWFRPYRNLPVGRIRAVVRRRLMFPRIMIRRRCLREGLVLFHFLRLAGHEPRVHFSVFPPSVDPARMHAHCWVTLDDRPMTFPPVGPATLIWKWPTQASQ